MANPTARWNWSFPTEGQDPWYTPFDTFATAIDLTVYSTTAALSLSANSYYQQPLPPRYTAVISTYMADFLSFQGTTNAEPAWFILSAAPYGAFVGSFSVANSGGMALLGLTGELVALKSSYIANNSPADNVVTFRACIQPGSITNPGSAWRVLLQNELFNERLNASQTFSPGAGNYSVQLQGQMYIRTIFGASSLCYLRGRWLLDALQVRS